MKTQAYFSNIQQEILNYINGAQTSISVAVAWLTDHSIFKLLCKKAQDGLAVQLLVLNDDINREKSNIDFNELVSSGGKVYFVDIKNDGGIMHHKFCVIDQETLITGSYNWSRKAKQNDENIIVTEDATELCKNFINEFELIKDRQQINLNQEAVNLSAILKRLDIIKNLVLLEELDEIDGQITKLKKGSLNGELNSITKALINQEFGKAIIEIDAFIQINQRLVLYNDPQVFALQLEIKSCEIELNAIENELIEAEKEIQEFSILQTQEIGEIVIEILKIKRTLAKTPFEKQQTEKDEDEYKREFDDNKKLSIPEVTPEELRRLTKLYREASMLCHPDKFQNEPEKLALAEKLFIQLNEAYKANDILKVEELLDNIKSGKESLMPGNISSKKDELIKQLMIIKSKIKDMLATLNTIKSSETFVIIKTYPDRKKYFSDLKSKLTFELSLLKEEALKENGKQ